MDTKQTFDTAAPDLCKTLERYQAEHARIGAILADLGERIAAEYDPAQVVQLQMQIEAAGQMLTAYGGPAIEKERIRRMDLSLSAGGIY